MRISSILISIFCAFSATGQTTQTGIVKEYNEKAKKTPLEGVELNVRSANSTVSDPSGSFTLQFLTLKPGEKVNVRRIEKLGYEVFNKEAIEQWNINPKNPFVIVMCRSDKFKKIRDNYEKVSSESYARQLKKEETALLKLKEQGKLKEEEYQKQLYELRENYETQLDNLDNYVDRFSRIDLSELSDAEQEIITLIQEGRIEEAIIKYEQLSYVEKYTNEVAEIKEVSSAIDRLSEVKQSKEALKDSLLAAIDRQIETLKLAGGKENFKKIEFILKKIADADSSNYYNIYKYGKYLEDQNQHILAIDVLNKAYQLCDDALQKANIAISCSWAFMGNSHYDEAVDIIDSALLNSESFDIELIARLLHVKASVFFKQAKFSEAKNELQKAVDILNGYDNISILGPIYYTMASLNRTMKNFDEAVIYINKALDVFNNQALHSLSKCSPQVIQCKFALAKTHYYSGNYSSALTEFLNLHEEYSILYRDNPDRFGKEYAWNQYMIAKCYLKTEDIDNACVWLNNSIFVLDPIFDSSPLICGKEYVQVLEDLGFCQVYVKNFNDAKTYYDKSTQIASYLYEIIGEPVKPLYLSNLYRNAFKFYEMGQYQQAIDNNLTALKLCESLYSYDNKSYGDMYSSIMLHLAEAYRLINDLENAKNFSEMALSIRINHLKNLGIIRNEHIGEAYHTCGSVFCDLENFEDAISFYDKAFYFYNQASIGNKKYKKYCVVMKKNIASICSEVLKDHTKAIEELQIALELDGKNISVLEQLGLEYNLNKDQKACVLVYQTILSIDPGYSQRDSEFNDIIKSYI